MVMSPTGTENDGTWIGYNEDRRNCFGKEAVGARLQKMVMSPMGTENDGTWIDPERSRGSSGLTACVVSA